MWFADLTGLDADDPATVRAAIKVDGEWLTSRANGRRMRAGRLTLPSLAELRAQPLPAAGSSRLSEVAGDAQALHADPANAGAVFQVASQFNLLEMPGPSSVPEDGIAGYAHDHTQGPACAMACGAGTIFRNYLVPIGQQRGQSRLAQLDALADLGAALGNGTGQLWRMTNGYALPDAAGLATVCAQIAALSKPDRDALKGRLRIGVQADSEVTLPGAGHIVTQLYCSALPIAYAGLPTAAWEPFARLVLEASYEACFRLAALTAPGKPLFLTLIGGGAFGNPKPWILDALATGFASVRDAGVDARIVSFPQLSLPATWLHNPESSL